MPSDHIPYSPGAVLDVPPPPANVYLEPQQLMRLRTMASSVKTRAGSVSSALYTGVLTEAQMARASEDLIALAADALALHFALRDEAKAREKARAGG